MIGGIPSRPLYFYQKDIIEDEVKVKSMIQETVGFQHVDAHVTDVMPTWIGKVVEQTCRELLKKARAQKALASGDGGKGKARS